MEKLEYHISTIKIRTRWPFKCQFLKCICVVLRHFFSDCFVFTLFNVKIWFFYNFYIFTIAEPGMITFFFWVLVEPMGLNNQGLRYCYAKKKYYINGNTYYNFCYKIKYRTKFDINTYGSSIMYVFKFHF